MKGTVRDGAKRRRRGVSGSTVEPGEGASEVENEIGGGRRGAGGKCGEILER